MLMSSCPHYKYWLDIVNEIMAKAILAYEFQTYRMLFLSLKIQVTVVLTVT